MDIHYNTSHTRYTLYSKTKRLYKKAAVMIDIKTMLPVPPALGIRHSEPLYLFLLIIIITTMTHEL